MSDDSAGSDIDWPVDLRGVTETVTTTLGPNTRWNAAALGVTAPRLPADGRSDVNETQAANRSNTPATARTWGLTRTRANFDRRGDGYVQFVDDPLVFVEAALGVEEREDPVLPEACAWARVEVERREAGESDGTEWVEWTLRPVEASVERRTVPTINRGFGAVVEATVWASRLDVAGYVERDLRERLGFLEDVVRTTGGERERTAFDRLRELSDY